MAHYSLKNFLYKPDTYVSTPSVPNYTPLSIGVASAAESFHGAFALLPETPTQGLAISTAIPLKPVTASPLHKSLNMLSPASPHPSVHSFRRESLNESGASSAEHVSPAAPSHVSLSPISRQQSTLTSHFRRKKSIPIPSKVIKRIPGITFTLDPNAAAKLNIIAKPTDYAFYKSTAARIAETVTYDKPVLPPKPKSRKEKARELAAAKKKQKEKDRMERGRSQKDSTTIMDVASMVLSLSSSSSTISTSNESQLFMDPDYNIDSEKGFDSTARSETSSLSRSVSPSTTSEEVEPLAQRVARRVNDAANAAAATSEEVIVQPKPEVKAPSPVKNEDTILTDYIMEMSELLRNNGRSTSSRKSSRVTVASTASSTRITISLSSNASTPIPNVSTPIRQTRSSSRP